MSVELIGIIILVGVGVTLLNRCNELCSEVRWLQARFTSDYEERARELEQLAPLFFMPLRDEAMTIRRAQDSTEEERELFEKHWTRLEQEEMEEFVATNPPHDKPFTPSFALRVALKSWSVAKHKTNVVSEWEGLFTDVFLKLLYGELVIKDAERRLKCVNQFTLDLEHERDSEAKTSVEEIFNAWASRWDAERWKDRLNVLRELSQSQAPTTGP